MEIAAFAKKMKRTVPVTNTVSGLLI